MGSPAGRVRQSPEVSRHHQPVSSACPQGETPQKAGLPRTKEGRLEKKICSGERLSKFLPHSPFRSPCQLRLVPPPGKIWVLFLPHFAFINQSGYQKEESKRQHVQRSDWSLMPHLHHCPVVRCQNRRKKDKKITWEPEVYIFTERQSGLTATKTAVSGEVMLYRKWRDPAPSQWRQGSCS